MKKPDEVMLEEAVCAGEKPRDAGERLGIPPNRVRYLCLKWADQGWYEYGITYDLGWVKR